MLLLDEPSGYHAVTVVVFRSPDEEHDAPDIVYETQGVRLVTSGFVRLYVHEDRLGPYSRMEWLAPTEDGGSPALRHLRFVDSRYGYNDDQMLVWSAVAPLYPKLRLTPRGPLQVAAETLPLMRSLVGRQRRDELRIELRFVLSGQYVRELFELGVDDPDRVVEFAFASSLPRYVGLVRFFVDDGAIGDVVCDTTDIFRERPKYGSILALFPLVRSVERGFRQFTDRWLRTGKNPDPG